MVNLSVQTDFRLVEKADCVTNFLGKTMHFSMEKSCIAIIIALSTNVHVKRAIHTFYSSI